MEIKYTIEILTKDIQDIEKLVGNLQNSEGGSAIELDLAMAKLRNVYEILTMIKTDRLHDLISSEITPYTDSQSLKESQPEPQPETQPEPQPISPPAEAKEPDPVEIEPETEHGPVERKEAEILAEKFSAESSINENLAGQRKKDMDSKLVRQPINNIGRNIGINDRFLIIRELFDGDANGYSNLIATLEEAGSYKGAVGLLEKRFAGSMEHEGVEILEGLVKRRFTQ